MKKILAMILVLVMVLGLCACQKKEAPAPAVQTPKGLQIGYAKVDITPALGCPLTGYGNDKNRLAERVLDSLYITAVAATGENGETVILCGVDAMNMPESVANLTREAMSAATGVPASNIYLSASHTHSAPSLSSGYQAVFATGAVEAAKKAMEDRSTATIEVASGTAKGLSWVRHYKRADGTYTGPNFGTASKAPITEHVSEADNEFRVVRFVRAAEDKKDVVMLNWQAHPTMTGGITTYDVSADCVGQVRNYVEKMLGVHVSYYQGAAGNLTTGSYITGETATKDYQEYGVLLGQQIVTAMENMTPVEGVNVKATNTTVTGTCDHTDDDMVGAASEIQALFASNGNDRAACTELGARYGIEGIYHANGIVSRSGRGETEDVPIEAASIGGVGFAVAPYEMTDSNGVDIREGSPFEMTFIIGYCNGYYNYIISDSAYDYSNYEFQTRRYTRGIGEDMANAFIGMLEELHG